MLSCLGIILIQNEVEWVKLNISWNHIHTRIHESYEPQSKTVFRNTESHTSTTKMHHYGKITININRKYVGIGLIIL